MPASGFYRNVLSQTQNVPSGGHYPAALHPTNLLLLFPLLLLTITLLTFHALSLPLLPAAVGGPVGLSPHPREGQDPPGPVHAHFQGLGKGSLSRGQSHPLLVHSFPARSSQDASHTERGRKRLWMDERATRTGRRGLSAKRRSPDARSRWATRALPERRGALTPGSWRHLQIINYFSGVPLSSPSADRHCSRIITFKWKNL